MQPAVPLGTVLQNRYRLVKILGQGGFGRTYLAEDDSRFKERVALKEFIPSHQGTYALKKSRELFQREAAVLYQIQHPQIPQFQATFEQGKRLFLVQDFVDGKPYNNILEERTSQGEVFSQGEVLQFLQHMLPVLEHIHSKNIIHRDISPDNIILRERDQLPILIDFGVVKEVAGQLKASENVPEGTTVGKIGYAPNEQLQTGKVYPSSDLYALAVTGVVFLTGRKPQDLLDEHTLVWHWQQWVPAINPWFSQVLTRMLSPRPNNRYQSASEVIQALRSLKGLVPTPQTTTLNAPKHPKRMGGTEGQATSLETPTNAQTVGKRPVSGMKYQPTRAKPARTVASKRSKSSGNSAAWLGPAILIGVVVLLIGGTAAIIGSFLQSVQDASTELSQANNVNMRRLDIPPNGEIDISGQLSGKKPLLYRFRGEKGQTLSLSLSGAVSTMSLLNPDRKPLAEGITQWQGTLPVSGSYFIQLGPDVGASYDLAVKLEGASTVAQSPEPVAGGTEFFPEEVEFLADEERLEFKDWTSPDEIKRYVINAQEGQFLDLQVTSVEGEVTFTVRSPDGKKISGASGLTSWRTQLLQSGKYKVDMIARDEADFTLEIGLSPLE